MTVAPLFAIVAGLLVVSGAAKLRAPRAAASALAAMSLPGAGGLVRIGGACELALGIVALVAPGRIAAAVVGAAYLGFAVFVAGLLRSDEGRSAGCGCFGAEESEVGAVHLLLNLAAFAISAAAVLVPPESIGSIASEGPGVGIPLAIGVAGAVYAAYLAYTAFPRAWGAYEGRGAERRDNVAA
jgi:hypothetical protein